MYIKQSLHGMTQRSNQMDEMEEYQDAHHECCHALYVAVYEHSGSLIPSYAREFMRHSSILVKLDNDLFSVHHVTGTPGIGMTYENVETAKDPRTTEPQLPSMDFVDWVARSRYKDLVRLASSNPIVISRTWNCQDWVRAFLDALTREGIITEDRRDRACRKQREVIQREFVSEHSDSVALSEDARNGL